MLAKYLVAGLAGSALLASAAFAQSPSTSDNPASKPPAPAATSDSPASKPTATPAADSTSYQGTWRGSKVVGLSVYNDKNESVGSINDLLMDKSGSIKAVVIGVGGFLGVGEHLVAMGFDKIKFVDEPVAYTGTASTSSTSSTSSSGSRPTSTTTTGSATPASTAKHDPWYPDHAVISANKDELKAMPEFKYSQ